MFFGMPELPEVEIVKRGLEPALLGARLKRLELRRPDLRFPIPADLPSALEGQVFESLQRRGKYILGFTKGGAGFVLHLGMSGVVRIENPHNQSAFEKHDHVAFHMDGGARIVFNDPRRFGSLMGAHVTDWAEQKPFSAMGPEPLSNGFSGPILAEKLKNKNTPIKTALLDQAIVAGVGNIYACEALFMAGISPTRLAKDVKGARAEKLATAIKEVLARAIEAGGSTLKDYKNTEGDLGYFQHQFSVYDRAGFACPGCECDMIKTNGVQQMVQAGRSTYFCQKKQR